MNKEQLSTLNWYLEQITGYHRCIDQQISAEDEKILESGKYIVPGSGEIVNFCLPEDEMGSTGYIPIDVWAETKHPKFLENVQAHIDILCTSMSDDDRYSIVRGIMQYTRQEFENG